MYDAASAPARKAPALIDVMMRRIRTDALGFPHVHDIAAFTAIVLLAVAAFSPWWAGDRLLAPLDILHETFAPWSDGDVQVDVHNTFTSDAVTQYLGYRVFAARSFASDGRIGWSDLTHGGRPEYANTMATYGDWSMQLHRVLGFWTAWHLGLLLQLIIAACGMYVLLRAQRITPQIALIGGIAFAASTPIVHTLYHRWHLGAFAWVPWAVWALLLMRAGSRRAAPLAAVFIALALLGGSLQTAVFVLITLCAVSLGILLDTVDTRARMQWTRATILVSALGAALAAFALVPAALTYIDGAALHGARNAPGYAHGWMQPLLSLLFIPLQAVPSLLGSPRSLDLARAFDTNLTNIAFFGVLPTLVAMRCAFWRETPRPARYLIIAGLLIPLTPLVGPLYHRVQIVFVFGGIWAFAHYWQHGPSGVERVWRTLGIAAITAIALWLAVSVVVALNAERAQEFVQLRVRDIVATGAGGQLAGFDSWMQERARRVIAELMIWHPRQLVALLALALSALALRLRAQRQHAAAAVLLVAVVIELSAVSASFLTFADARRHAPWPARADIAALRAEVGDGRVHLASRYSGPALLFPPNTLALYGVATLQQFETVDVPGMWHAADSAQDARTLGRLAVTHAITAPDMTPGAGWQPVITAPTFRVWRNAYAVPRYVALPPGAQVDEVLAALQQRTASIAAVRVEHATANRRTVVVPARTGMLRVAENWSEGWQYRAHAGSQDVARAPDGSMLMTLAPSDTAQRVVMWYSPQRRRTGLAISFAALLLLVPVAVAGAPRKGP